MKKYLIQLLFSILVTFSSVSHSEIPQASEVMPVKNCKGLSNHFLENLKEQNTPVSIFLVNGIKLQGRISDHDCEVILLQSTVSQMVYIHAISTIVPGSIVIN